MGMGTKLNTPLKYAHYAEVEGSGEFPFDMLRYDACYPRSQEDVMAVAQPSTAAHTKPQRAVRLVQFSPYATSQYTPARWQSFGWTLREIDEWEPHN